MAKRKCGDDPCHDGCKYTSVKIVGDDDEWIVTVHACFVHRAAHTFRNPDSPLSEEEFQQCIEQATDEAEAMNKRKERRGLAR